MGALNDLNEVRGFLSRPTFTALLDLPWVPFYVTVIYLVHPLLAVLMVAGGLVVVGIAALAEALLKGEHAAARPLTMQASKRLDALLQTD